MVFPRPCVLLTALFLSTSQFALWASDDRAAEAATEDAIAKLIAELDDNEFSTRERATRELIQAGERAVKPVAAAAQSGSLETTVRAVNILQAIYKSDADKAVDAAIVALEQLMQSENRSVAARAELVLVVHGEVRNRRAKAAIKKLGGIFDYQRSGSSRAPANGNPLARPGGPFRRTAGNEVIVLSDAWQGGDAGLIHLKRLTTLRSLVVTEGSGITQKGLDELTSTFPQLFIQPRGRACLGIEGGGSISNGCAVSRVRKGSAAEKGGILRGDVITIFNGRPMTDDDITPRQDIDKPIDGDQETKPGDNETTEDDITPRRAFDKLIESIKATKPGEKIAVEVLRKNERLTLEVIMGKWAH